MLNDFSPYGWYELTVFGHLDVFADLRKTVKQIAYTNENGEQTLNLGQLTGDGDDNQQVTLKLEDENLLRFHGDFCDDLPHDVFRDLSRRHPSCRFTVEAQWEIETESRVFEYASGYERLVSSFQQGMFRLCDPSAQPVAHWDINLTFVNASDEAQVLDALDNALRVFTGFVNRVSILEVLDWINENFPNVLVQDARSTPLTLDEHAYRRQVCDCILSGNTTFADAPVTISEQHQAELRVIERPIALNAAELTHLFRRWLDRLRCEVISRERLFAIFSRLERLRNQIGREVCDSQFLPEIETIMSDILDVDREYEPNRDAPIDGRHLFRHWFIEPTEQESVTFGYGHPFEPLAEEIGMLLRGLTDLSAERRNALETALANPRWTQEWPDGDAPVEEANSPLPSEKPHNGERHDWRVQGF